MVFWESYFRDLFAVFLSDQFQAAVQILYALFPLWGPPTFAVGFYFIWLQYVRAKFLSNQKYTLLEIRLPRDVFKSPLAMELALSGLNITGGESNWYDVFFLGKQRPFFSFEIVSIEGNLRFFIWTRENLKTLVESQIYGQYPDVEIFEVLDYTTSIPYYDMKKVAVIGYEAKLEKADPYPIKTYVDFGLDENPEEEFKIDPLTPILEYMTTLNKGEHMWIQILIQGHKAKRKHGTWFGKTTIQDEAHELIKVLLSEFRESTASSGSEGQITYSRIPTKGEAEVLAAIDRASGKLNFDCGIRLIYATKPDSFIGARITPFLGILRPFATKDLNSFGIQWGTLFNITWLEDPTEMRRHKRRKEILKAYRYRSYFQGPYKRKPFVLSSEELATIFHFPGKVLQASSVDRVMSKKAEAPGNLPY